MTMVGRISTVKMFISPKVIYRFSAILIKIVTPFSQKQKNLIPKIHTEHKIPNSQGNHEQKEQSQTLPVFKMYYKDTAIKSPYCWQKNKKQEKQNTLTNGTEQRAQKIILLRQKGGLNETSIEKTGFPHVEEQNWALTSFHIQIERKLKCKTRDCKTTKRKQRRTTNDIGLGKDFFGFDPKRTFNKNRQMELHQIKKFLNSKGNCKDNLQIMRKYL